MEPNVQNLEQQSNVLTENGLVRIENLRVGDMVIGLEDGKQVKNRVEEIEIKKTRSRIILNGKVALDPEQSIILANGNVTHAKLLKVGDWVVTEKGRRSKVKTLEKIAGASRWYRMTIDGNHSYIVNGLLLHNASRFLVLATLGVTWDASNTVIWSGSSGGAGGSSVPGSGDTVTMDGASGGGKVTLGYSPTVTSITMGAYTGEFDVSTYSPTVTTFSNTGTGARTLTMTNMGTFTITGNNATIWNQGTSTNLTINRGGTIACTYSGSTGTRTFNCGNVNVGNVNITAGTDTFSPSSWSSDNVNFTGFAGTYPNAAMTSVAGSLTFAAGMSFTGGSGNITMTATSGTKTLTTAGAIIGNNITIDAPGATILLGDALNMTSARNLTITNATLFDANAKDVNIGIFISSNANTRVITMSSGQWTLTGSGATIFNLNTTTGLTLNLPSLPVICNYSGGTGTRIVAIGTSTAANAVAFNITAGTDIMQISNGIGSVNFTGFSGSLNNSSRSIYGSMTLSATMTVTSGTLTTTFAGTSAFNITTNAVQFNCPVTFSGVGGYWTFKDNFSMDGASIRTLTLTNGTIDAADSGANHTVTVGAFSSSNSNARTITPGTAAWTLKGNATTIWTTSTDTNLTITTAMTLVCDYSGSTGVRTVICGATESKAVSFSVTAGTDTFTATTAAKTINFTGFTGTWSNDVLSLYGNLTLTSGMTISAGTNALTFAATSGTQTVTSNTNSLDRPVTHNGTGGTVSLADNFTVGATRTLTVTAGTFTNGGGSRVISAGLLSIGASGTLTLGTATHLLTGVGTVYANSGTVNGLTTCILKVTDTSSSAVTVTGGVTFNQIWFARGTSTGANNITGSNTFTALKDTGTVAHSLLFVAGTTQTLASSASWQVSGNAAQLISVSSSTAADHYITCQSGVVSADYLNLSYSKFSGGANAYAGSHSTDGGNNSGWNFSDHGSPTNSAFFALPNLT